VSPWRSPPSLKVVTCRSAWFQHWQYFKATIWPSCSPRRETLAKNGANPPNQARKRFFGGNCHFSTFSRTFCHRKTFSRVIQRVSTMRQAPAPACARLRQAPAPACVRLRPARAKRSRPLAPARARSRPLATSACARACARLRQAPGPACAKRLRQALAKRLRPLAPAKRLRPCAKRLSQALKPSA
jgi:hypothetical protein